MAPGGGLKAGTKRKRSSRGLQSNADSVIWTATRCLRLLRPLTSRIEPLRKLQYTINRSNPKREAITYQSLLVTAGPSVKSQKVEESQRAEDPSWLPGEKSKANTRCYKARSRNSKAAQGDGGNVENGITARAGISLPTPFKARAARHAVSKTPSKVATIAGPHADPPARKPTSKKSKRDPFGRTTSAAGDLELQDRQTYEKVFDLHEGILDGFSSLLERTASTVQEPPRLGSRSLFSMCLRKVPDYIQEEQDWRDAVDPDDETDVTSEVYEELESMSSAKSGWSSLRIVVRAHGIAIVKDLILEKMVSMNTRADLLRLVGRHGDSYEFDQLCVPYSQSAVISKPTNIQNSMWLTEAFGQGPVGNASFHVSEVMIKTIGSLITTNHLPLPWLGTTETTTFLSCTLRLVTSQSSAMSALKLFETVLDSTCAWRSCLDDKKEPIQELNCFSLNTAESLLTILTTMAMLSGQVEGSSSDQSALYESVCSTIRAVCVKALRFGTGQRIENKFDADMNTGNNLSLSATMGMYLLELKRGDHDPTRATISIRDVMALLADSTLRYEDSIAHTAGFVTRLALCCGQSASIDSLEVLREMTGLLLDAAAAAEEESEKLFLHQVSMRSAKSYTKHSASREARLLARDVEDMVVHTTPLTSIPCTKVDAALTSANHGFRWEEGLCEWIAATPFVTGKKSAAMMVDTPESTDDSREPDEAQNEHILYLPKHVADLDDSGYLSGDAACEQTPCQPSSNDLTFDSEESPDVLGFSIRQIAPIRTVGVMAPSPFPPLREMQNDAYRKRPETVAGKSRKKVEKARKTSADDIENRLQAALEVSEMETNPEVFLDGRSAEISIVEPVGPPAVDGTQVFEEVSLTLDDSGLGLEDMMSDVDELAFSCRKSRPDRVSMPLSKTSGGEVAMQKVPRSKGRRKEKMQVSQDGSDDELGL